MTPANFWRFDPFHTPAWRWNRAHALAQSGQRLAHNEDAGVAAAARYLRAVAKAVTPRQHATAARHHPHVAAAEAIYRAEGVMRDEVEARLLADEAPEIIATKTGLSAASVTEYRCIFFDVPAFDQGFIWALLHVVKILEWRHRDPSEGDIWRYAALAGGPVVLDLLIDDAFGRPDPKPAERSLMAQRSRFLVQTHAEMMRSPYPTKEWVEESERLFSHLLTGAPRNRDEAMIRLHMRSLRMAAGMPPPASQPKEPEAEAGNARGIAESNSRETLHA